ncbi:uncharacterized protein LY79DRAFT_154193 [Colletotrichum navitas]|uniref:Transmembrane protein n=1 Tax=Colletotrichum navitas TaxID=681940 RepID=A0AAD8V773_9PEZI|nr:uncharacterized protein LY79DRAFT_154193 [Colletotrichum navitas]KAK1594351.1 hypothetical protein LY79DRAFT_154193 [Colletotrichum navitas]
MPTSSVSECGGRSRSVTFLLLHHFLLILLLSPSLLSFFHFCCFFSGKIFISTLPCLSICQSQGLAGMVVFDVFGSQLSVRVLGEIPPPSWKATRFDCAQLRVSASGSLRHPDDLGERARCFADRKGEGLGSVTAVSVTAPDHLASCGLSRRLRMDSQSNCSSVRIGYQTNASNRSSYGQRQ